MLVLNNVLNFQPSGHQSSSHNNCFSVGFANSSWEIRLLRPSPQVVLLCVKHSSFSGWQLQLHYKVALLYHCSYLDSLLFNYLKNFVFFNYTWHSIWYGVFFFKQDDFLFSQGLALGLREAMTMKQFPCERRKCKNRKEKQWRGKASCFLQTFDNFAAVHRSFSPVETGLCPAWLMLSQSPSLGPTAVTLPLSFPLRYVKWLWDTRSVLYSVMIKVVLFLQ